MEARSYQLWQLLSTLINFKYSVRTQITLGSQYQLRTTELDGVINGMRRQNRDQVSQQMGRNRSPIHLTGHKHRALA